MDAHASATAKADPEGYVTKSRELAEKKPASLYAGIIGVQSVGPARHPQACQAIQCWHWHRPPHCQARRRAEADRIDLFLHQQGLDTTMPAGKMMFQVLGSFAEYERDMIRARVNARIARAKAQGKHCGRPPLAFELAERIREALAVAGRPGIRVIAKQFGVSPMTVQNVARG